MITHNGEPALKVRVLRAKPTGRQQQERPLPPKLDMARNALKAAGQALMSGFKKVSDEEQARRLEICEGCEFFRQSDKRCSKCGCQLNWKSRLASWHCPIEKW
jgi:hypothetical protein